MKYVQNCNLKVTVKIKQVETVGLGPRPPNLTQKFFSNIFKTFENVFVHNCFNILVIVYYIYIRT